MPFDKTSLKQVSVDLQSGLNELGEKLGLSIKLGKITFTRQEFTAKLQVCEGVGQDPVKVEARRFLLMDPSWKKYADAVIRVGHRKIKIVGLRKDARTFPVLAEDENGKLTAFKTAIFDMADKDPRLVDYANR